MLMQRAEDDELDLTHLPQLVEYELAAQSRRRKSKGTGRGGAAPSFGSVEAPSAGSSGLDQGDGAQRLCGLDGCTKVAWHSGMCQVVVSSTRRKRMRATAAADELDPAPLPPPLGVPKPAQVQGPGGLSKVSQIIAHGARLAQTPVAKGTKAGRRWAQPSGAASAGHASTASDGLGGRGGGRRANMTELEEEEAAAQEEEEEDGVAAQEEAFPPSAGMHVAIDQTRRKGGPLPSTWEPIATVAPQQQSNVGEVSGEVRPDGSCDVVLVCHEGGVCSGKCGAGTTIRGVHASHRQLVCSTCLQANLPHALPHLRCSACDMLLPDGIRYRRAAAAGESHTDVSLCIECFGKLFSRYELTRAALLDEMDDEAARLTEADFACLIWQPEEEREFDDFVQCTRCDTWHHYVCAAYPAPEQLPRAWRIETEQFVCAACCPIAASVGKAAAGRRKLAALQLRRAADLPTCVLSDTIEEEVADALKAKKIRLPSPIVVRVVSRKRMLFEAPRELRQRYGAAYAPEWPYLSQAIYAFQEVGGRDVCLFAMYVQEYDADCPPPNTNRTYISYVDSVRYLDSDPAGARTPVYAAILHGYLRHAGRIGLEHAHLWVAPPENGAEYVFHCRPAEERPPMSMEALRAWYERVLTAAQQRRIISGYQTLEEHTAGLTSVRDFPLFHGDFFPEKVPDVVEQGRGDATAAAMADGSKARGKATARPTLKRTETLAIADRMRHQVSDSQYSFLVASLAAPDQVLHVPREKQIGPHELVDSREHFLEMSAHRHWQNDELRRAQWSTMMLLAILRGAPDV